MSIQTEINRINTAKNNILNSISNKGVDTSSVETLGDIPELIDSITTKEDLDAELIEQSNLLSNQGTTIDDIKTALQGKGAGSGENYLSVIDGSIESFTNGDITSVKGYAFYYCKSLTTFNAPNVISIGASGFNACSSLNYVNIPSATSLGGSTFMGCTSLIRIDLPKVSSLRTSDFNGCSALATLILRKTSVISMSNTNALNGTPIANGTGYVYVPDDLVSSYKTATNWSTYASQIKGLSEL